MKNLFFDWEINDHTGWGIYGLNLLIHGSANKNKPVALQWPPKLQYPLDPIASIQLQQLIDGWINIKKIKNEDIVLQSLGSSSKKLNEKTIFLTNEVAIIFFENWPLEKDYIKKLKRYEKIVVGSKWNFEKLNQININSIINIQGVDTENLRPINKKKFYINNFVIFSGGKLEFRKGQDIILSAFAKFSKKYKDSILLTAWQSPWQKNISQSINLSGICEPFIWQENFNKSVNEWAHKNKIAINQFVVLDQFPNQLLREVFREVDLALFTNRCEGGTNLVAMEALASGVTCGISRNTGHNDIITKDNCIPLENQKIVNSKNMSTEDWGETSVDECIHVMEQAYEKRLLNQENIINSMQNFTWKNSIDNLYKKVL